MSKIIDCLNNNPTKLVSFKDICGKTSEELIDTIEKKELGNVIQLSKKHYGINNSKHDYEKIIKNLHRGDKHNIPGIFDLNKDSKLKLVICGGHLNRIIHDCKQNKSQYEYKIPDIDFFIYKTEDVTLEEVNEFYNKIVDKMETIINNHPDLSKPGYNSKILYSTNAITFIYGTNYRTNNVQFIRKIYSSIEQILDTFDLYFSQVCYQGEQIYVTPKYSFAYRTNFSYFDLDKSNKFTLKRHFKYSRYINDYKLIIPHFDYLLENNYIVCKQLYGDFEYYISTDPDNFSKNPDNTVNSVIDKSIYFTGRLVSYGNLINQFLDKDVSSNYNIVEIKNINHLRNIILKTNDEIKELIDLESFSERNININVDKLLLKLIKSCVRDREYIKTLDYSLVNSEDYYKYCNTKTKFILKGKLINIYTCKSEKDFFDEMRQELRKVFNQSKLYFEPIKILNQEDDARFFTEDKNIEKLKSYIQKLETDYNENLLEQIFA